MLNKDFTQIEFIQRIDCTKNVYYYCCSTPKVPVILVIIMKIKVLGRIIKTNIITVMGISSIYFVFNDL